MTSPRSRKRVLMVGLDGCEPSLALPLMAAGRLPALQRLESGAARCRLEHGGAKRTGLAWEHVSTGLDPDRAERWAAVDFDPTTYAVRQRSTQLPPFAAGLDARVVVVDAPYFDLLKTDASGIVGWGAHDPGVPACTQPAGLAAEIAERFGDYVARDWIYGFVWPSAEKARRMADALIAGCEQRRRLAQWMLGERFPDWDLGLVVVSEYHSAVEALWHGVDPGHPLHDQASAAHARRGVEGVYEAVDRMIGALMEQFPDATFVVFNLHGMGPNNSDNASMVLLPELMYRCAFGRRLMRQRQWPTNAHGAPLLRPDQIWRREVGNLFEHGPFGRLHEAAQRAFGNRRKIAGQPALDWMPATRYQPYWRQMRAFALPSFYDGRIRINVAGRERDGMVDPRDYGRACDEYVALLEACTDTRSGEAAVERVERHAGDPLALGASAADLIVVWSKVAPLGLNHPALGEIGPLPYRRTGGHTGEHGFAYFHGPGVRAGDFGARSAFDVVPTVLGLLNQPAPKRLSGAPLELSQA